MAVTSLRTQIRNGQGDAVVDAIDLGSGTATGKLKLYTSAFGTLLVDCLFANPAFGATASGVATANAIGTGTVVANGTAAVGRVVDRDANILWEFTVGTSGQDLNLTNVTLAINDTVSVTSMTWTQPAS